MDVSVRVFGVTNTRSTGASRSTKIIVVFLGVFTQPAMLGDQVPVHTADYQ